MPRCGAGRIASTRAKRPRATTSATPPTVIRTRRLQEPDVPRAGWGGTRLRRKAHRFSVAAVIDRRAEQYPDRVMMSIGGIDVTFEQMRQRSCAAANALLDLGIASGDCVALFAGTCRGWLY